MVVLDTNHISVLERRGAEAERLLVRLSALPASEVFVTVISYEEQFRGWMAAISQAKNGIAQATSYQRLLAQLENYCNLSVLPFDAECATLFDELRKLHRRTNAPDLKIAAIVMMNQATLLTQNERDFKDIDGLRIEDWTQ